MADKTQRQKERANRLLRDGRPAEALAVFEQIFAEDSAEIDCLVRVAELSRELGKKDAAIAAHRRLAERFAQDGLLFRAISVCKAILELEPEHTQLQEQLAELYALQKKPGDSTRPSAKPVKRRLSIPPSNAPSLRTLIAGPPAPTEAMDAERPPPRTPLFSDLSADAFLEIVSGLKSRRFDEGHVIIHEGERGDSFFILSRGRVRIEKKQSDGAAIVLATLSDGAFFGEMALLQDTPRTASVIAEETCDTLEINRALLDDLATRYKSVAKALRDFYKQRLLSTAVAMHPFFQPFTPAEQRQLTAMFRARVFAANEEIIREGQRGQGLYLLLSGALDVVKGSGEQETLVARLGAGEMVGEMSLLRDMNTTATVRANEDSWVLRLSPDDFRKLAGDRPEVLQLLQRLVEERLDVRKSTSPTAGGDVLL